jgi:hypothetical protein
MKLNQIIGYYDGLDQECEFENCDYIKMELLGRGEDEFMIISKESLQYALDFNWYLGKDGYPVTYGSVDGKIKCRMKLYHLVIKINTVVPKDMIIDHINRNKLDNRLNNLRICTSQENSFNRTKNKNSKNGLKGVKKISEHNWSAIAMKDGIKHEIRGMLTEEEAGKMYDLMAEDLFGEFAGKNY